MTLDNARNVLGVTANTSEADTKKAYRRLALEKHPDKNNGKDEEFKKINEAYSILTGKQEAKEEPRQSAHRRDQKPPGKDRHRRARPRAQGQTSLEVSAGR